MNESRHTCEKCGNRGPVWIPMITEDYVLIRCAVCAHEWTNCTGMDMEK